MMSRHVVRKSAGFTLVELMIVVVIVAILMAIAAPSFFRIIQENETRTQASRVVTAMNVARSSSVENNTPVSVCASNDQATCTGSSDGMPLDGFLVFIDNDKDQVVDSGDGDIIVQVYDGLPSGYYLKDGFVSRTYFPDGTASGSDQDLLICPPSREEGVAWNIAISAVGRPTMTRPSATDCN